MEAAALPRSASMADATINTVSLFIKLVILYTMLL